MEAKPNTLTVSQFRCNMAAMFDLSDAGEDVYVRRGNKTYAIVPVSQDNEITPELQAEIEQSRRDFKEGKGVLCSTIEELQAFLDSL